MSRSVASLHFRQLELLRVSNRRDRQPTRFGWYLLGAMDDAGFDRATSLAEAMGTSRSNVSRWIYDDIRPTTDTCRALAAILGREYVEVLEFAGHGTPTGTPSPRPMDPLAMELDQMIGVGSPLPDEEQQYLRDMTERLISPYRRKTRRRSA
jgi:transcriptional regulator with XRE-family HTH domain